MTYHSSPFNATQITLLCLKNVVTSAEMNLRGIYFFLKALFNSVPLNVLYQRQQAAGVTDQFIQEGNNISEFGPMTPLLLPAVQHQLVQGHRASHRRRQPVSFFN